MASVISMVSLGARLATTSSSSSSHRAISRSQVRSVKNINLRAGRTRSLTVHVHAKRLDTDSSYNCVVNKEGVIIADDIPSGVYEVSAWWAGATKDAKESLAPKCDSENQRGCEVRCEMTAEGELVCEGLNSGTYRVINAEEYDATCSVEGDAFECTATWDEDEDRGPVVMDTGDLKMKETPEEQNFRMGG